MRENIGWWSRVLLPLDCQSNQLIILVQAKPTFSNPFMTMLMPELMWYLDFTDKSELCQAPRHLRVSETEHLSNWATELIGHNAANSRVKVISYSKFPGDFA